MEQFLNRLCAIREFALPTNADGTLKIDEPSFDVELKLLQKRALSMTEKEKKQTGLELPASTLLKLVTKNGTVRRAVCKGYSITTK